MQELYIIKGNYKNGNKNNHKAQAAGKSREKGTPNKERKPLGYSVEGEGEQAGTSQTISELQRCQDDLPKGTKQNRKQKESAKK